MRLLANILIGHDNDSYMYSKNYPNCCDVCHYVIKREVNPEFHLTKKTLDVSYTYDGYLIVSEKFKHFCELHKYKNVFFHSLPKEPKFYYMESNKIIPLDYQRRKVEFIKFCSNCNRYAEVIGTCPSYISSEGFNVEDNCFYRSEYEFGSYNSKSPIIIVSIEIAKVMKDQKFKGLIFKDILE